MCASERVNQEQERRRERDDADDDDAIRSRAVAFQNDESKQASERNWFTAGEDRRVRGREERERGSGRKIEAAFMSDDHEDRKSAVVQENHNSFPGNMRPPMYL